MKTYAVKEMSKTLQGEGYHAGRAAIFVRFAGCNLWSGREEDRPSAICRFCDTDFVGTDGQNGGRYTAGELVTRAASLWGHGRERRFVVFTGGEPALQVDGILVDTFHRFSFEVAIETNGTVAVPSFIDWVTVSPKAGTDLSRNWGSELKLVYPQDGIDPASFERLDFRHFYIQPKDGPDRDANTAAAVRYCMDHPNWKLSIQTHKFIGIN